jgi:hypothetical protein
MVRLLRVPYAFPDREQPYPVRDPSAETPCKKAFYARFRTERNGNRGFAVDTEIQFIDNHTDKPLSERRAMRLMLPALMLLSLLTPAFADATGAEHVKEGREFTAIFVDLVPLTVTADELTLLTKHFEAIETWATENKDAWNSVNEGDDPIKTMLSLELWEKLGFSGQEFLAISIKLMISREINRGNLSVGALTDQVTHLEELIAEKDTDDEMLADLTKAVADTKKMLDALKNYPESNGAFYESNKEAIDDLLDRLDKMGS